MDSTMVVMIGGLTLLVLIAIPLFLQRDTNDSSDHDPIAIAEVYITYDKTEEAKELLEVYLRNHPDDQKAMQLLQQIDS